MKIFDTVYVTESIDDVVRKKVARNTTSKMFITTGRERLIRSHSSARFCFELSGNSN